jgi:hypothetical protein
MRLADRTVIGWAMAMALCGASARGAEIPGALPGDDALTCDQIYAQGMAESQKDQQAQEKKRQEMKAQSQTNAALITAAAMTGGMGGTGLAAQKSAEASADRMMAELAAPPKTNPRLDRLKELFAQKHCVMKRP